MAGNEDELVPSAPPSKRAAPPRPTISLPPRASMGAFFGDGAGGFSLAGLGFSPGPMTLVSSMFSPTDECKSFSQLLAGAMASPAAHRASDADLGFKQNLPDGLVLSPAAAMFMVPPGLTPATLLDSPGLFSPRQGPFGMTHQQALAQVTAQAAAAQAQSQIPNHQTEENTAAPLSQTTSLTNSEVAIVDPPPFFQQHEQSSQIVSYAADNRPANDGYNWRKYGQKQVKGSEFPRSYYKCSHLNCPVKKKVEHALDGHVREIIYKGQHNHPPPQKNKRAKEAAVAENSNAFSRKDQESSEGKSSTREIIYKGQHNHPPPQKNKRAKEAAVAENSNAFSRKDQESSEVVPEHSSPASDGEEVDDSSVGNGERDEDEPEPKRRNMETTVTERGSSQRTVTESRIIVQTRSEVDLLDDGYRWRKYGQKVVKGNPYPRSYYKCTMQGCNVRKHVERAAADPKSVITTYEGKHNHTIPAAKISSHHNTALLQRSNQSADAKCEIPNETALQQPVARLRFKEEQNG